MSMTTRVGMVAALGAATSLLVVAALTQADGQPQPGADADPRAGGSSSDQTTYVPLEGIPLDAPPEEDDPLPATGADGEPIVEKPE